MRVFILGAAAAVLTVAIASAQPTLYVGLSNSKGYVVGAKLQESGLFRYSGDTSWVHIGWNHPFVSGVAYGGPSGTWHLASGNGALRSADDGESWKITTGWRVTEAQHIAIDHFDPILVYLATSYGIWRSLDDGVTWSESSLGLPQNYTQAIAPDRKAARRVVAATEAGIYVSDNSAAEWRQVGPSAAMIDVEQSAADHDRWIAGSRSGAVYLSTDGGLTWSLVTQADSEVTGVAADPSNGARFAFVTYGGGAHLTEDGGATWRDVTEGLPLPYLVETVFAPTGGRLWVATKEEGIYHTDDGGASWTYAGMTGTMVFDMVFVDR
ncbi:MAG TPA: hypothetical protein VGA18_05325 [Rhodothermales bacterium]